MVDIMSPNQGRLSFMARGARRDKSKFLNTTAPFTEAEFELVEGRNIKYIKEARILDAHLKIRENIGRLAAGGLVADAISASLPEGERDENFFFLYKAFLNSLEEGEGEKISHLIAGFFLKFAAFLGFRPTLSSCLYCGKEILPSDREFFFMPLEGGMACEDDFSAGQYVKMNYDEYSALVSYISRPLSDIINSYDFRSAKGKRMAYICLSYWRSHTALSLGKSLNMLRNLGYI